MTNKKVKRDLTVEIAPIRDAIPTFGGILSNPDEVLMKRGRGPVLKIYEDLETDAHVRTVVSKRKNAVIAREWVVKEADETPQAVKSAEMIREHLEAIKIDNITKGLLDAVVKGYSVAEIIWESDGNEIRPAKIKMRKQDRFIFATTDNGYELRLKTKAAPFKGISVPDKKFIVFSFDERYENPYGFALGNCLYWPVFFKRKGITFWLIFCDKFGTPTSIGTYPSGASEPEKQTLKDALMAIAQDSGIVIPEGMDVKLLEAAKSGIDTYENLVRYMDEQISEAVLGETGTTNQSGTGGSNARDQVGNEVRIETAKADGDAVCELLNNTLIKWDIELNMPGAPIPKLWRDFDEPEDLLQKAERDSKIASTGQVKFQKQYWVREYNFQDDDIEIIENVVSPVTSNSKQVSLAAPNKPLTPVDNLIDELDDKELQKQSEVMLLPIIKLVDEGKSYEDIMEKLIEIYDHVDTNALMEALEKGIFAASIFGRIKNAN